MCVWNTKETIPDLILNHPMHLRRLEFIEHIFLACAVLHNMLIDYDGHDDWEECEELKG
jgi:hypothetical protein